MNNSARTETNNDVCLVHDWLIGMRGGEKVLEALCEIFPKAPIYTLFSDRSKLSDALRSKIIKNSFLHYLPGIKRYYRWLLPLFPLAVTLLPTRKYRLIISSSHCVAKAVRKGREAAHICYCHSPMRYVWGMEDSYFASYPLFLRQLISIYFNWLRSWDRKTAQRVDYFIANSKHIASRISSCYERDSIVIYPPVTGVLGQETPVDSGYYLVVSALVPYKRVDLAVDAFNELKRPLIIVGDGPLRSKLQAKTTWEGIRFEGWLDDKTLGERYLGARALIFPGEEDFGIVPVEAQFSGKPVIAFNKGGVCESVQGWDHESGQEFSQGHTGVFFNEQTSASLMAAVKAFETAAFDSNAIGSHAQQFSKERFIQEVGKFISHIKQHQ